MEHYYYLLYNRYISVFHCLQYVHMMIHALCAPGRHDRKCAPLLFKFLSSGSVVCLMCHLMLRGWYVLCVCRLFWMARTTSWRDMPAAIWTIRALLPSIMQSCTTKLTPSRNCYQTAVSCHCVMCTAIHHLEDDTLSVSEALLDKDVPRLWILSKTNCTVSRCSTVTQ